jgi:hypothetical protein
MGTATTKKATGFADLRCPHCEEVTRAEVEAIVDRWARLLAWIDSAATFADPQ